MKIWIINPYGNLPDEGWREYRSSMVAESFAKKNHEVVWWVSNFEHRSKRYRSNSWKDLQVNDNYLIRLVPSSSYSSHISLARIKHERNFANNFRQRVRESDEKPDLIIVAEPALFFSDIIIDVIKEKNIPFIVDILDLWPELFNIILPRNVSHLGRFIFAPLFWRRSWFLKKADGIIGATNDYLNIATHINRTVYNEVVYLGIDMAQTKSKAYINRSLKDIKKYQGEVWVIYAGTLGSNYDIKTIIDCARKIEKSKLKLKIFIAGEGVLRPFLVESIKTHKLRNLVYIGRLDIKDLTLFYHKCDMALSSYVESSTVSMPVKAFDYLAAGLPLINSLKRELGEIVVKYEVGLQYQPENADDMFRAIKQLSKDKVGLQRMKENSSELARSFDKNLQYDKLVTLSEKLVFDNNTTRSII